MNRLLVRLYLDEDVALLVATLVRLHGFDVHSVSEAGRAGLSDEEQLAYAVAEDRAIVTHNRDDFAALAEQYRAAERHHHGILIAMQRPPRTIAGKLVDIINRLTADDMDDLVLYL